MTHLKKPRSNGETTNDYHYSIISREKFVSYLGYAMLAILLSLIASDTFAVDLAKFGKGVTDPMVKFAEDYWVYGAGIGGITTSLLSEGDGRTRVIRGGTVFLGASAICTGILAALK